MKAIINKTTEDVLGYIGTGTVQKEAVKKIVTVHFSGLPIYRRNIWQRWYQ